MTPLRLFHEAPTGHVPAGCHVETTEARDDFYIGPVTVTRPALPVAAPAQDTPRQSAKEFFGGAAAEVPFDDTTE